MTRKNFEKILEDLQELEIYDIDDAFYNVEAKCVANGIDKDEHRWYELSTSVYKVGEWFIGANGITKMYSEQSCYDDIGIHVHFFEMKEIPSVTYEAI